MTPYSRTRCFVSVLALLSLAGCSTTPGDIPGTSPEAGGDVSSAKTGGAKRTDAGLSNALSRVGHTAAASGNFPTAVRMYRRAHDLAPDQVGPALGLARASSAVKDHRAAADAYRSVLRVEPQNVDALSGLGRELMSLDRPSEAIPFLKGALAQRREAWVHNELGVAFEMTGDLGSAMEQYQAGLELAPRDLSLRTNLGRTLAWTGDYEAAVEVLRAVAADPEATRSHREALALVFALGGDIPSAQNVSRVDLPAKEVDSKLAYFGLLGELARSGDRDAVAKVLAGSALRTVSSSPRAAGGAPMVDDGAMRQRLAELDKRRRAREDAAKERSLAASSTADAAKSTSAAAAPKKLAPRVPDRVTRKAAAPAMQSAPPVRTIRAKAVMAPKGGPYAYQVQLAAFRTPERAEIGWKILHRAVPELLGRLEHFVRDPNPKFEWDRLFRLRTLAYAERAPADTLCTRLKSKNLDCLVVQTQRLPGLRMASESRVAHADTGVGLESPTSVDATAHVAQDGDTTVASRRPKSPEQGSGAAHDVMQSAVEDQSTAAHRMAKKAAQPPAAYQVQFAAYRSAKQAEQGWRLLSKAAPDLLGKLGHTVAPTESRDAASPLHRLRTLAYANRVPAQTLCDNLKRRGIECMVVSTPDHAGLVYEPSEFERVDPPPAPKAEATGDGKKVNLAGSPKDFDAY